MNYYNFPDTLKVGAKGASEVAKALRLKQPPYNLITIKRKDRRKVGCHIPQGKPCGLD